MARVVDVNALKCCGSIFAEILSAATMDREVYKERQSHVKGHLFAQ